MDQEPNNSVITSQSAKRSRNSEIDLPSLMIVKEEPPSSVSLLKEQIEIQTKLYDAVSELLEDNKAKSKSMRYNTRKIYEALEAINNGIYNLIHTIKVQNSK